MGIVDIKNISTKKQEGQEITNNSIYKIENKDVLKDLLCVWDFRTVPYSIGDIITFLERLQIEKTLNKINKFDIVFVYDKNNPERLYKYDGNNKLIKSSGSQKITVKNFHKHFLPLISTFYISKHIGSFFIFDDYNKLYKFIEDNKDRYVFLPSIEYIKEQRHFYRENFNFIQDFFIDNGYIPELECREGTIENINLFYSGLGKYPVVCHIRNSESQISRNSNTEEWVSFFKKTEDKYQEVIFIVIGTRNDTKKYTGLKNVIISKDFFNTVEDDMVLIKQSLFFLGTRSGPFMMAFFSSVPCVVFDYMNAPHERVKYNNKYIFMNEYQNLIWLDRKTDKKADCDCIYKEFEKLYNFVDKNKWKDKIKQINNNKSGLELI